MLVDFIGQDDSGVVLGTLPSSSGMFCKSRVGRKKKETPGPPHKKKNKTFLVLTKMLYAANDHCQTNKTLNHLKNSGSTTGLSNHVHFL